MELINERIYIQIKHTRREYWAAQAAGRGEGEGRRRSWRRRQTKQMALEMLWKSHNGV
jgi:hypothetical protein